MTCFWLTLMSKLYYHQSASGRLQLRTSVTKYLGGSDQWLSRSSVLRHGHSLTTYLYRTLAMTCFSLTAIASVTTRSSPWPMPICCMSGSHPSPIVMTHPMSRRSVVVSVIGVCVCDRLVCLSEGDAVSCGKKAMYQCHVRRASNTCHHERRRGPVELGVPSLYYWLEHTLCTICTELGSPRKDPLWSSLDRELPYHLTDCWRTVVTVKLPSPCGVSVDAWKNPMQNKATTLWLVYHQLSW